MTVRLLAILGVGLVDPGTPVLRADDLGLTRGDGCFEGCRVVTGADGVSAVNKLDAHLARLSRSAAAMGIAFDEPAWRGLLNQATSAWTAPGEAAMKLLLTRGSPTGGSPTGGSPTGLVTISPLPEDYLRQRRDGIRVVTLTRGTTSDAFTDAPWLLGGVKTLSYAVNMAAHREALRRGADDVVFVSTDGHVLESAVSSVVWSSGRELNTTPVGASGILGGTTQELLFARAPAAGWRTSVLPARVADLQAAQRVWLIGTVRGPVDVIDLDGTARDRDAAVTDEVRRLCGFGP
ncbi:MAG: aminodeoxychorismate lyase [Pseudonocardiales bacterium]|nr:MAG: aminodeoxychorismate lyase [Pseudonocardiales bacterium]